MKNTFFRSTVAAALLAVGVIGCAPLQQTAGDEYYDPAPSVSTAPSRIWVDDPYRPGASILMERDAFSGRYYPVPSPYNTYGRASRSPYSTYDPYYGNNGGYYGGRPRSPRPSRGGGSYRPQQPQPSPQQEEQVRRENAERRQAAGDAILGRRQ